MSMATEEQVNRTWCWQDEQSTSTGSGERSTAPVGVGDLPAPAERALKKRVRRPALLAVVMIALAAIAFGTAGVGAQEPEEMDRFLEECGGGEEKGHEEGSRLSDHCQPLTEMPERPRPILELGEPFLGTGTLHEGIRIPGGAVWQPSFLLFGTVRTAGQGGPFGQDGMVQDAVARLDLFGNLYLTQTERVLVGLRPLDEEGCFTGYTLCFDPDDPSTEEEFGAELNATISTLFFEGDLGELFPSLDRDDSAGLDVYFSVGRQPLAFQDGMLLNEDILDMVGLTRSNMRFGSGINTRITGVFGWGQLNRHGPIGNVRDDDGMLFGLFTETDFRSTTLQFDAAYVAGSEEMGDAVVLGLGDIRRFGHFNSTFRVLASVPTGDETPFASTGVLLHEQFSWTPYGNYNLWYIGAFAGIEKFRSAARGPSAGGPVGATGILFAAPGIGRLGAPLSSFADNSVGGSIGHQMFFAKTRQQLILEVGGRTSFAGDDAGSDARLGVGARYQAAMGRRFVFVVDGFGTYDTETSSADTFGRVELVLKL